MFQTGARSRTHTSWSVLVSFLAQVVVVASMVLMPLIYTEELPPARVRSPLAEPPPPHVKIAEAVISNAPARVAYRGRRFIAPAVVPSGIPAAAAGLPPDDAEIVLGLPPAAVCLNCVPGGTGQPAGLVALPLPPPPPPSPRPQAQAEAPRAPVRVGGDVQSARLVRQPRPAYPPLALQAGIQGTVRLHAVIGRDGIIRDLSAVAGHPLLVPAAIAAVRQWLYRPTLLNGEPVEVATDIEVRFTLAGRAR